MISSAVLSQAEQDFAWAGTLELTNPASFGRIQIDDSIDLELGGEFFKLIVDNKTLERDGVGIPRLTVSVISPAVRFTMPYATPLDKVWDSPVWAKDAAEEAIGEAIQWDASMPNWLISGGRLAVHQASPMDIVKTLTNAVGGMVESLPDGALRVRHRFPVAVPNWATAAVDHTLTDTSDNLSCRESHILRTRVNKVLVRGYLPSGTGFLSVEVDSRPDGLNHGRTSFFAGDTAHLCKAFRRGRCRRSRRNCGSSGGSVPEGVTRRGHVSPNGGTTLNQKETNHVHELIISCLWNLRLFRGKRT
ncbi:MAG: hypothetical protein HQM02_05475 [Magnetococcales bacterium]|nr:hypothetical protein [Magnetococcales bacterium]